MTFANLQNFDSMRFLCAQIDFVYTGPNGDGNKGAIYFNNTPLGYTTKTGRRLDDASLTDHEATLNGHAEAWPQIAGVTSGVVSDKWNFEEIRSSPTTKSLPVGTSFSVKLYPSSMMGDGFTTVPNQLSVQGDTTFYSRIDDTVAAQLPNLCVILAGGAASTTYYDIVITSNFEMVPSDSFSSIIPGQPVPLSTNYREAMHKNSSNIFEILDSSIAFASQAAPYAASAWQVFQNYRRSRR
jgi:hypothetical protein